MGVMCNICEKIYSSQTNLNKHLRNVHTCTDVNVSYEYNRWNNKCHACCCSYQKKSSLIKHLEGVHKYDFHKEHLAFQNTTEFENWKAKIETEQKCFYFVALTKKCESYTIKYYNCNRSKGKALKKHRKRNLKSQGSCKLDFACVSFIKVKIEHNQVNVTWSRTHNHPMELQHIPLSKADKKSVASKLVAGVSSHKILEMNQDSIGEHLRRIDLLTNKDIQNIRFKYKIEIKEGKRHPNDAISIDFWVKEEQSKIDENMVLLYKRQGEESSILEKNDFCLILMNTFQKSMFKLFGNNIIAIDGTHGLNKYDFEMTTIMIVDEFGEGVPVSFMFSNRKDRYVYELLFKVIKDKIGVIESQVFMSDMADNFYYAWCNIMQPVKYNLYCSWHVDRAWQANLNKIQNKNKQAEVYKISKVLQTELNPVGFVEKLVSAINMMLNDEETKSYGIYFRDNYLKNYEKWAYCCRKTAGINTNMRLESMHKIIKYFYLDHKKIKRLDKGLHAVLKYLRRKSVERIIKLTKGKNTTYNINIFKFHKLALESQFEVSPTDKNIWEIKNGEQKHLVLKHNILSSCCKITCSSCQICVHMYSCSCPNFSNNLTICKHIHFIEMFVNNQDKNLCSQINRTVNTDVEEIQNKIDIPLIKSISNIHLQEKIKNIFIKLENIDYNQVDNETIAQINVHLNVLHNLTDLNCINFRTFEEKEKSGKDSKAEPDNKNILKQPRFFSTKKKRKRSNTKCKKPTATEVNSVNNLLSCKDYLSQN